MATEIRLNAFEMNCVLTSPRTVAPPARPVTRLSAAGWVDRTRENVGAGAFRGLFFADVLGVYDVFGGESGGGLASRHADAGQRSTASRPSDGGGHKAPRLWDNRHLSYEPPFPFARRMSTLDHLTDGRIGWNVVTGYSIVRRKGQGKRAATA